MYNYIVRLLDKTKLHNDKNTQGEIRHMEIKPLTQQQVQDKINKTMDLNNKEFKEMLSIQFGDNIIAQRQLQNLRNTILNGKGSGTSAITTFEKLTKEALQLREAIKLGNEFFTPSEIGDMFSTLGRHLKRLVRYVKVDKLQTLTQDHIETYNDLITTSKFNVEKAIKEIAKDREKLAQRKK